MQYTCSIAMSPIDQLVEIAKTAEEVGFDSIALPDSLFYMEKAVGGLSVHPRRLADVERRTPPWVDPLIAAGAMGAVTSTLRFYTNVMKLGSRNPLLLARQVGSVANLTNNRFGFGVGIGWAPEEFEWCGVPYAKRGKRVDEMIEVIKLVLDGGMVEFHGEFYDFDKLQMSPAPTKPVPFYVGGHTEVALQARRAGRRRLDQRDDDRRAARRDDRQAQSSCWPRTAAPTSRSSTRRCASTSSASTATASSPRSASPTTSSSRGCSTAWASMRRWSRRRTR